jgi:hypothetical protein
LNVRRAAVRRWTLAKALARCRACCCTVWAAVGRLRSGSAQHLTKSPGSRGPQGPWSPARSRRPAPAAPRSPDGLCSARRPAATAWGARGRAGRCLASPGARPGPSGTLRGMPAAPGGRPRRQTPPSAAGGVTARTRPAACGPARRPDARTPSLPAGEPRLARGQAGPPAARRHGHPGTGRPGSPSACPGGRAG